MVFYSTIAFSFLTLSSLTSVISLLCSLFFLRGSWSIVLITELCLSLVSARRRSLLVAGLYTSPISLLSVTWSLYSLAATTLGRRWWLRFGPILGFVVLLFSGFVNLYGSLFVFLHLLVVFFFPQWWWLGWIWVCWVEMEECEFVR